MTLEQKFGNFFKSEIKTSGVKLLREDKVTVASHSDRDIHAYVRASSAVRVRLSTQEIASEVFTADCTCPVAQRNQFCKHIWATLLCVEQKVPDFLSAKRVIEKPLKSGLDQGPIATEKSSYQESAKLRANVYRKEQYQKQKLRAKALKQKGRSHSIVAPALGGVLGEALAYFEQNGFPMVDGPSAEVISEAKRKLSRVFHPDKGGSNEEMVELNRQCEVLMRELTP